MSKSIDRVIHKFHLQHTAIQCVRTKGNPIPLHVAMQGGKITVWIEVDADGDEEVQLSFFVKGTGHNWSGQGAKYIGTVHDNEYVWHIYFF